MLISDLVGVIRSSSSNIFDKTEDTSSKKYLFVKLLYFTVFIISSSRILEKLVEFLITEIINLPCFLETWNCSTEEFLWKNSFLSSFSNSVIFRSSFTEKW